MAERRWANLSNLHVLTFGAGIFTSVASRSTGWKLVAVATWAFVLYTASWTVLFLIRKDMEERP